MLASSLSFCSGRASALFAECIIALQSLQQHLDDGVLLAAQLLGAFSLAPEEFLSISLRARVRWTRLLVTLTAVCAVLLLRTFFEEVE